MNSFLTLHVLADGCNEQDINRAGRFLAACNNKYYNLTAAARYNESEKLIRLLHAQAPNARPIWRGWPGPAFEDGGIWQRMRPQEWVNYRIAPNDKWLRELNVLVLPCNEVGTLGADARTYAQWEADAIKFSFMQFGVHLAVLRLSTGNPLETEHENYNAVLQAASEYDAILSPNEYTSTRSEITTNWHVGRFHWMWNQQDKLGVKRSPVVIGEYAIARINADKSPDPFHGYVSDGVNIEQHLSVIKRDGLIYQLDGVSVCWYVDGHWQEGGGSFDLQNNEALLTAVETTAKSGTLNMVIKSQPNYAPSAFSPGKKYTLQSKGGERTNVYKTPIVAVDNKLGQAVEDKTIATLFEVRQVGFDWWYRLSTNDIADGWVSGRGGDLTWTPVPVTGTLPQPDVPPEPEPSESPPPPAIPPGCPETFNTTMSRDQWVAFGNKLKAFESAAAELRTFIESLVKPLEAPVQPEGVPNV